ncbi:MAG: potassium channel family protein [Candidatus Woesearchaeota archaeon]
MGLFRNFMIGLVFIVLIMVFGGLAIHYVEDISVFDGIYYSFLSITTLGPQFVPETSMGRFITGIIVFLGVGTMLYTLTIVASAIIEGRTKMLLMGIKGGIIRMKKEKNHVIVCGYGRLGKYICQTLKAEKKKYIIIDNDPDVCSKLLEEGESIIQGDALKTEILEKAYVQEATALIASLGADADNIYLVMNAQELNPKLLLAARADDETAVTRLHKMGAQIVVLPEVVGGKQLAHAVLQIEHTQHLSTISRKKIERELYEV